MEFSDDDRLLTAQELSKYLRRSRRQLRRDRAAQQGIPFLQLGMQVRYRLGDVRRYVARHRIGS